MSISLRQDTPENLQLAAAAWQSYADGKKIWYIQFGLLVISGVAGPIIATSWQATRPWVALVAVIITVLDQVVLEPMIRYFKERGAKIQDSFDCAVFELSRDPLAVGKDPAHEDIVRLARRRRRADPVDDRLRRWYPEACGGVATELGTLVAQRASTRWDSSLREELILIARIVIAVLVVAGAVVALAANMTMDVVLLSMIMPMLPLLTRVWRECSAHRRAAQHSERLRVYIDELWAQAKRGILTNRQLVSEARGVQTQLYRRRAEAPFVPTKYYELRRKDHDQEMNVTATRLIEEAKAARQR